MIIKRVRDGEIIPWYYSRVYYDCCRKEMVVSLFPFCYAVLMFYRIRDAWYRYHGRPTWIDDRIQEALLARNYSRTVEMLETCINAYAVPKNIFTAFNSYGKVLEQTRNVDEVLDES